jgi:hypothetical protein
MIERNIGYVFGLDHFNFGHSISPSDWAQGGESFDSAQDREPVDRLVETFRFSANFIKPGMLRI